MASFFREYAQDLMLIEGIESRVKDAIRALYADDDDGLCSTIATVTDPGAGVRKKLPGAIRAYLAKARISLLPGELTWMPLPRMGRRSLDYKSGVKTIRCARHPVSWSTEFPEPPAPTPACSPSLGRLPPRTGDEKS